MRARIAIANLVGGRYAWPTSQTHSSTIPANWGLGRGRIGRSRFEPSYSAVAVAASTSSQYRPEGSSQAFCPRTRADCTLLGMDISLEDLESMRKQMGGVLASYRRMDQFIEPTLPVKYPRDAGYRPTAAQNTLNAWYWKCQRQAPAGNNTGPFDLTGHPAISVPCGSSQGLPVGMMLIGRHWRMARSYEWLTRSSD
jgi:Asp-tRNA(Asn)/Glu-tRNA(Gln) amidotransferase A subunit family amidase